MALIVSVVFAGCVFGSAVFFYELGRKSVIPVVVKPPVFGKELYADEDDKMRKVLEERNRLLLAEGKITAEHYHDTDDEKLADEEDLEK